MGSPEEFIVVPDVVGMIQQEAHVAIRNAGLRPHNDGFETTTDDAANTVIRQDPPSEAAASPGETVSLTIGAGKPVGLTIPDDEEIVIPIPRDFVEPVERSSDDTDDRPGRGW